MGIDWATSIVGALLAIVVGIIVQKYQLYKSLKEKYMHDLKSQLDYTIELYEKSVKDWTDTMETSEANIIVWKQNTFLLYGLYREGISVISLPASKKQILLEWFSAWESVNAIFNKISEDNKAPFAQDGFAFLQHYHKHKETFEKCLPVVKDIRTEIEKQIGFWGWL